MVLYVFTLRCQFVTVDTTCVFIDEFNLFSHVFIYTETQSTLVTLVRCKFSISTGEQYKSNITHKTSVNISTADNLTFFVFAYKTVKEVLCP